MKRILSFILILILSLGALVACQNPEQTGTTYDLDNAKAYVKDLYPELFPTTTASVRETRNSFNVTKVLNLKDGKYTVAWTVTGEGVEVVDYVPEGENDKFSAETTSTVKIPEGPATDINYTLTATITAPNNTTAKLDIQLVVPASNIITIAEALAAEDGVVVEVKGTVETIDTAWSDSYGNISVTIKDANGDKLYLYRLSTKVEVGDVIVVTGTMATYNGARQIAQGGTAKIVDHEDITVTYEKLSIPEVLASDDGRLVEVSGTVISIDTPWSDSFGNITVTIKDADGNELYVYRLSTNVELGDIITLQGKVGSYNGNKQIAQGATAVITGHDDTVVAPDPTPDPIPDPTPDPDTEGLVLSVDTLEIPSQQYIAGNATINGVDFEFVQMGNYGNGLQMRDKEGKTSSIWNTSAFSKGIAKIVLVYSSTQEVKYSNADAVIFTFGNEAGEASYETKLSTTAGVTTYTITPNEDTYTFFKLEHDLGYTFYWESITIVFAE